MLAQRYNVFSLIDLDPLIPATRIFFPTEPLSECLALELRDRNIESVRIAEACKFPHVTRFFDGLNERLPSEAICIESLPEAALAEHPEMSIDRLEREVEAAVRVTSNRLAVVNIANLDQVGHLGRYDLAVKAAAHVDAALSQILRVCHDEDWTVLITSDHGNADRMIDSAGRPFGSHTERPVPFVAVPAAGVGLRWRQRTGSLANIAPSMLAALDLPIPGYMDASLLERTG
jgi:2,3-bisphosphoglycerate-independent phosphoglycerate mutase